MAGYPGGEVQCVLRSVHRASLKSRLRTATKSAMNIQPVGFNTQALVSTRNFHQKLVFGGRQQTSRAHTNFFLNWPRVAGLVITVAVAKRSHFAPYD